MGYQGLEPRKAPWFAQRPQALLDEPMGAYVQQPSLGANYAHWQVSNCSTDSKGVIRDPDWTAIQSQLRRMRASGLDSLRTILWHIDAYNVVAGAHTWGVVDSTLPEPYAGNLARFVREVGGAGFKKLELAMGAQYYNNPADSHFEPQRTDSNWRFLQKVKQIAKQNCPVGLALRYDLENEAAPLPGWETYSKMVDYARTIWTHYVQAYGARKPDGSFIVPTDCTISAAPGAMAARLIELRRACKPNPRWYSIHLYWNPAQDLLDAAKVLPANVPLVIGECYYDNAEVARAVKSSPRAITRLNTWPLRAGSTCANFSESPPYVMGAYA